MDVTARFVNFKNPYDKFCSLIDFADNLIYDLEELNSPIKLKRATDVNYYKWLFTSFGIEIAVFNIKFDAAQNKTITSADFFTLPQKRLESIFIAAVVPILGDTEWEVRDQDNISNDCLSLYKENKQFKTIDKLEDGTLNGYIQPYSKEFYGINYFVKAITPPVN